MQGVVTGFSTGLGAGIANYFFVKRFDRLETELKAKIEILNGRINGNYKNNQKGKYRKQNANK